MKFSDMNYIDMIALAAPSRRALGFALSMIPIMALLVGGLAGVMLGGIS